MSSTFTGVDWGTSAFRAARVVDGLAERRIAASEGALSVPPGGHADALKRLLAGWPPNGPIVLSGMVGSRQGWREAPYAPCPADAAALAAKSVRWREPGLGDIVLLPGVTVRDPGGAPDVMRGEETQIFGAMNALGVRDGVFILPGTHSKSADVRDGQIEGFATFMTGEIYGVLKAHSVLGRLMSEDPGDGAGFALGVGHGAQAGPPGALLHRLFATRTLGLFNDLPAAELDDYLSGLLIGAELAASLPAGSRGGFVVGADALTHRYQKAAQLLGMALTAAPGDCALIGQGLILEQMP